MRLFRVICFQLLWAWQVPWTTASAPLTSGGSPQHHCDVGAGGSSFVQLASRALHTKWAPPMPATATEDLPWWESEPLARPSREADMPLKMQAIEEQIRGNAFGDSQGADAGQQPEELGPVAPALSMLELFLEKEQQPRVGLGGPDSAGETADMWLFYSLYALLFSMVFMAVPFVGLGSDNCWGDILGNAIKAGVQKFDRSVLGVDVEIGHLVVNPFDGYVDCEHLIVHNPEGYSSQYLLKASRVLLDIDMVQYVQSGGHKISLERLVFKDIEAIYEKKWATSNVQEVLAHLDPDPDAQETLPTDDPVYEVHRVDVQNISVNIRPSGAIGEYVHLDVEAGDVFYKDFYTEVGHIQLDDIVKELLKSILKTVIANVAGQHASQYLM